MITLLIELISKPPHDSGGAKAEDVFIAEDAPDDAENM